MSLWLKDIMRGPEALELTLVSPEEPCDVRIVASTDVAADEFLYLSGQTVIN